MHITIKSTGKIYLRTGGCYAKAIKSIYKNYEDPEFRLYVCFIRECIFSAGGYLEHKVDGNRLLIDFKLQK